MDDRRFDLLLEEELTALPLPDEAAVEVKPWKQAMNHIVSGIVLTTITLQFFWLDYLLPAAGVLLLYLGFRTLRQEDRWLRFGWIVSLMRLGLKFLSLVSAAAVGVQAEEAGELWASLTMLVTLTQLICLWKGIRAVRRKAGQPDDARAAGALIAWYLVLCVLALVEASGWLLMLPMLAAYICILRNLLKLTDLLNEAGYQIQAASVRVSDTAAWITWFIALLASILLTGLLFGRYPMEWTVRDADEQTGLEELRGDLIDLGFPEYVLNDLTAEDLADCAGAIGVVTKSEEKPMNDGREVREEEVGAVYIRTVYDVKELKFTHVTVKLPGDRSKVFYHFVWQEKAEFQGMECIRINTQWCDSRSRAVDESRIEQSLSGRLLYDKEGVTRTSPFYALEHVTYVSNSWFMGPQQATSLFAEYSQPKDGERCRGYVSCFVSTDLENGLYGYSVVDFVHQKGGVVNYPARTPREHRQSGGFQDAAFKVEQAFSETFLVSDPVDPEP